jgi:hypothetical protein
VRDKKKVVVRFVQKNAPYNVGEIAGFPVEVASRLVRAKKAIFLSEEDAPAGPGAPQPKVFEPIHVGGGYYEVDGHRLKGKKAAAKYAAELNSKSGGETPEPEE